MDPPENGFPGLVVGPRVGEEGTQGGPRAGEQPGKRLCLLSSSLSLAASDIPPLHE